MRVLILDPGAIFGYAFGDPLDGKVPFSGTFKLPDVQLTKKMIALESWAMEFIQANAITDVFIEQNIIPHKTSFSAVTNLAGYTLFAGTAGTRMNCNVTTIELQTWRSALRLPTQGPKTVLAHPDYARFKERKNGLKEAKRQWVKDRAMDYARKQGCTPKDDNESDAICMYFYKRDQIIERNMKRQKSTDLFEGIDI